MNSRPLSLRVHEWPSKDRELWATALRPAAFLELTKPASSWSPARRRIVEQAYGQWLRYLQERDALNPIAPPADRLTDARLNEFMDELRSRVAPASASMMIGALLRMLEALQPGAAVGSLRSAYNHLKTTAVSSRNKGNRIVPASELFDLGIHLMDTCHTAGPPERHVATRFRDGLLIAILIACPVRLKNLAMIRLAVHLVFEQRAYRLVFSGQETKTGVPYCADLPGILLPYVDRYLSNHRPVLQLIALPKSRVFDLGGPFWLDRWGQAMRAAAIRDQIKLRTKEAFGQAVWPHLFRDCAATELVDSAPDEIGLAPDILGHRDLATTKKHYIQASGMSAHRQFQNLLSQLRDQAVPIRKGE